MGKQARWVGVGWAGWGLLVALGGAPALARPPNFMPDPGGAVMRAQSHALTRAISKNLETLIRPRLRVTRGATGAVTGLALSDNEQRLVTTVGDQSVRVWDLRVGREVARLRGPGAAVTSLSISPRGDYAFARDQRGGARLWDLERPGRELPLPREFPRQAGPAVFAEAAGRLYLVTGEGDGLSLWAMPGLDRVERLAASSGPARALVASQGRLVVQGTEGRLQVFNLARREPPLTLAPGPDLAGLALDGDWLMGGSASGALTLWHLGDGQARKRWRAPGGSVRGIAIGRGAERIASGGQDGVIRLWSRDGAAQGELKGHEGPVGYLQFNREGSLLLSASDDGTTRVWQVSTGQPVVTLISTQEGWAVVDAFGRFEGNDLALQGIDWAADQETLPIDAYSAGYYQPGLLPTGLRDPGALEPVRNVTQDGVHLPPQVRFPDALPSRVVQPSLAVQVTAEDRGGGVQDLFLFQNGKRVRGLQPGPGVAGGGDARTLARTYQVPILPGDNMLTAVALSREGVESRPAVARVQGPGAGTVPKGTLHLVLVGVNSLGLRYPVPDAQAIETALRKGAAGLFTDIQTIRVFTAAATRAGILDGLRQLRGASPRDVAVVYLAGHGGNVDGEWYFVPGDLTELNPGRIRAGGLASAELRRELEDIAPQRVLLLIDACDSGLALTPVKDFSGLRALRLLARSVGLHVLAATDRDRFALEVDALSHSVFAYAVLEGLRGQGDRRPRDGRINVAELVGFVEETVPRLSQQYARSPRYPNGYPQVPTGYSRGSGFDLIRVR